MQLFYILPATALFGFGFGMIDVLLLACFNLGVPLMGASWGVVLLEI